MLQESMLQYNSILQYFDQILHTNAGQHNLTTDIVAPVCVSAPASVNVDNNGRYRSRYCKRRVYNNGTVSVTLTVISLVIVNVYTVGSV